MMVGSVELSQTAEIRPAAASSQGCVLFGACFFLQHGLWLEGLPFLGFIYQNAPPAAVAFVAGFWFPGKIGCFGNL